MEKELAEVLLDAANGREECDLVIKNARIADVYNQEFFTGSVYIKNGYIVGFDDDLKAKEERDAEGRYLIPGFIDAHCHIESSHLSPSEYSDAVVPTGCTTVIADPHEICNVTGLDGLEYMLKASEDIPLSVYFMVPSCVPATAFEHSGAVLLARDLKKYMDGKRILGLGEMMNYPGVLAKDEEVLKKLSLCWENGKNIDGHCPSLRGKELSAYVLTGINTDHEAETAEELREKTRKGMYVMLRQGTACQNVRELVKGVDEKNISRILFCTDDRQPQSITREGGVNYGVSLAIREGLDPALAIRAASLNAALCYGLSDRGSIAPGKRADFFLTSEVDDGIKAEDVYISGTLVASGNRIIKKAKHTKPENVAGKMDVKDFSKEKLRLTLKSDCVRIIDIVAGGVVTKCGKAKVKRDEDGVWIHDPEKDILKISVIERHHATGLVSNALIRGYGLKHGAVATSIAHDSHNIIVVGDNDEDMELAVKKLIATGGGITMFRDREELATHVLEIAGLMTDATLSEVTECLDMMHEKAEKELGVSKDIDPFMTLCFMALPVIPALKLTDSGLFDVNAFSFVPLEAD